MNHADRWAVLVGTVPFFAITYDAQGRRSDTYRASSSTGYGYDAVSRLTSENQRFTGDVGNVITGFGYNPASQITSRTRNNDDFAFTGYVSVSRA